MELANSILTLQPGMYILRHPKTGMPPLSISRAAGKPEHNGTIQALYTPATNGALLRDGRDCIVMQVLNAPVELLVTAYLDNVGAAVPALKIDKIALEGDAVAINAKPPEVPVRGISLVGHIERRGDVVASAGQTLGNPAADLRIEGFQIMWPDKPDGIELLYAARVEGAAPGPLVSTGTFSGTKNAAQRLVEVTFQLSGPRAGEYDLSGVAHFSGGFNSPVSSGAKLTGPSGLEHLTGLSVSVGRLNAVSKKKNLWDASSRTRVLKSRTGSSKNTN